MSVTEFPFSWNSGSGTGIGVGAVSAPPPLTSPGEGPRGLEVCRMATTPVAAYVSGQSGAVDGDVAVGGAAADLDGLVGVLGPGGVLQLVAYVSEAGVDLEPGGGALGDADVQVPHGGAEHDRASDDLAEADGAVV